MLDLHSFLLEECRNVETLLDETLRHSYRPESSQEFYVECLARLETISSAVKSASTRNKAELNSLATELSKVSALITRIERSHLGEFPWPFASALEQLAVSSCHGTANSESDRPLFFISSGGGLGAYRIFPEQDASSLIGRHIFNIVFPRSLRYQVLLHPILGHEIGHAAYSVPSMNHELQQKVIAPLVSGSPFENAKKTQKWLKTHYGQNYNISLVAEAQAYWVQEYLCDLFGLLLMGPSFLPAHRSLLYTLDATGKRPTLTHPPSLTRYDMLDVAHRSQKWHVIQAGSSIEISDSVRTLHNANRKPLRGIPSHLRVFERKNIRTATKNLAEILKPLKLCLCDSPSANELQFTVDAILSRTPPAASTVNEQLKAVPKEIDFRTILYSGWLAYFSSQKPEKLSFFDINKLCGSAILQQQTLKAWTKNVSPT